jgi:tetratricopeptide (TPR) repeat protein
MLSPRFTENLTLVALLLILAGCAGSGPARDVATEDAEDNLAATGPTIPPEALTLFEQATASQAAGDLTDAELRFKEFLLVYPEYPGAYVNLAIIHIRNENEDEARKVLDAALALDPNHPAALNQLGLIHRRNGKFLEAEATYLKAITVSPDYALAHYNLGILYELYLQRLEAALKHFEAYQALVGEDKQVERWIADLKRRLAARQPTASVAE